MNNYSSALLAQSVEHSTVNRKVVSSNLTESVYNFLVISNFFFAFFFKNFINSNIISW